MRTMRVLGRLAVLGVSLLLLASPGNAAGEFKGKFDLPVEARWGNVDLEPGKYKLLIFSGSNAPMLTVENEDGKRVMILAIVTNDRPVSDKSALTLVQVDGKYFIRTLEAGDIGEVLTFRLSSRGMPELARNQKSNMHIPVTQLGK